MSIRINSIEDDAEQIVQDIESKTNQITPAVPFSYNRTVADAVAAQNAVTKLHNVDQRKECFAQTATEFVGLPLLAQETNTPRGKGDQAILTVTVTGTDGTVIGSYTEGPEFVSNDIVYQTILGATISGPTNINVKAKVSGAEANLQPPDEITLSSTYTGIDDTAVVVSLVSSGTNPETVESWRKRIIQEQAFPSTVAGTTPWFAKKAVQVPGITAAYPYSSDTLGKVDIYLSADGTEPAVPTSEQMLAVESVFKIAPNDCLWSTLPDRVNAKQSVIDAYTATITQGATLSASTQDAVFLAVKDYFESRAPFIEGFSLTNTGTISVADVYAVVQNVVSGITGEKGYITDVGITAMAYPTADIYIMPKGLRAKGSVIWLP